RVQELMEADRLLGCVPRREVLALKHPRHGDVRRLPDNVLEGQLPQPRRVELDTRSRDIEDLPELRAVRLRIHSDLVPGEWLARLRAPGGIADHTREVADDHDDLVAEV